MNPDINGVAGILLTPAQYNNLLVQAKGAHLQQELVDHHEAMEYAFDSIIPRVCGNDARAKYQMKLSQIREERK